MVTADNAVIARYKSHGANFEILVDCNLAIALKGGAEVNMHDLLAAPAVFSDSKKGERSSSIQMKQAFGTDDAIEAAKQIIKKGEVQVTAEYRAKLREQKRKQVISYIQKNGVDPKTNIPHTPYRIETALEEAKFKFDEYKSVEEQVNEALKAIRPIIPIKFVKKEIAVKIPSQHAGKAQSMLHGFGKMLKSEWLNDGSWAGVFEIPGGLENEFYDKLNTATHGDNITKILRII